MLAGGLVAVHALRQSANSTRQLAEERLVRLQNAQDLVERTFLIEREADQMLTATSLADMRVSYDEIIQQMESVDQLVEWLGTSSADVSVLKLHQSSQLFRNTAHIVAGLREANLQARAAESLSLQGRTDSPPSPEPDLIAREERLRHFHGELRRQSVAMAGAANELSTYFTNEYRAAVQQVATASNQDQRWMLILFLGSLGLAGLIYRYFLRRQVLLRLQEVSNYLRLGSGDSETGATVPVEGGDEIGEMARAVEQFLVDRRRLAEANAELEAFSYSVSHDLRAPLRAIDGFSKIVLQSYQDRLDEDGRSYLERIHQNAIRMRDLIEDILEFSRMSRHKMASGVVDMSALAKEVFEEVRSAVPERNVMLHLGELPAAMGDAALIRQVLVNLISNAVKFTAGKTEAVIEVTCINAGGMNTYRVKDNGIGFDMQHAGELFGVFQRIYGSEKFEGTGIGLAIVKRIVVRHGGKVWAESKPGEGASMFFTLPSQGA